MHTYALINRGETLLDSLTTHQNLTSEAYEFRNDPLCSLPFAAKRHSGGTYFWHGMQKQPFINLAAKDF